jgi:hypothetical protein
MKAHPLSATPTPYKEHMPKLLLMLALAAAPSAAVVAVNQI